LQIADYRLRRAHSEALCNAVKPEQVAWNCIGQAGAGYSAAKNMPKAKIRRIIDKRRIYMALGIVLADSATTQGYSCWSMFSLKIRENHDERFTRFRAVHAAAR
jgi:hypothetical protein